MCFDGSALSPVWSGLGEHVGKIAFRIIAEVADYRIRHAEDAGKLQNTFVDQLQKYAHQQIVAVQEIENDHVRLLPLSVTTVDALLKGERIVRQIVVDNKGTEFQIETFRPDIRGNENFASS